MINYQCPGHLSNLVPPLVSITDPCHCRRPHGRVIPANKTELYANSFISVNYPAVEYINSNYTTHKILQLACLKIYLSTNDTMVPIYYYFGSRKEQVKHCRLRLAISDLNYDFSDATC